MISLCPRCHARVHRTKAVIAIMPPLLLVLWREQHPRGHEQTALQFWVSQIALDDSDVDTGGELRRPGDVNGNEGILKV